MSAYLIGIMDITDPAEFANYTKAAGIALAPYAGRFRRLSADRNPKVYEGTLPSDYMFVIEFESRQVFEEFYNSELYQEALRIRRRSSLSKTLMLMEGDPR